MLVRVPTIKTKINLTELIGGLVEGWYKKFNVIPQKKQIGVLYAQNALETGGTVSMWNYNIGNVKAKDIPGQTIEYCVLNGVWEIVNGKKIILSPEDPGSWFRSFPTLADGVAHHLDFLRNKRYKNAWTAVESGDPAKFAHLLKIAGYYTASEADYTRLMNVYFNKFMKESTFDKVVDNLIKQKNSITPNVENKSESLNSINNSVTSSQQENPKNEVEQVKNTFNFINKFFDFFKKN